MAERFATTLPCVDQLLFHRHKLNVHRRESLDLLARGREAPDLVLKHARVVNVLTNEIYQADVAIHEGYVVGVRVANTSRPWRSKRSIQPPISVTSMPPSGSGVAPFGEASDRGGSWEQPEPPSSPMIR